MADWRLPSSAVFETIGQGSGSTFGTTVSESSIHTKSSWTEISASISRDWTGFWFWTQREGSSEQALFDVGIGAAGSEQAIIQNIPVICWQFNHAVNHFIPIAIPAGTRVAVRAQFNNAPSDADVCITGFHAPNMRGFSRADDMGADTANTKGTLVDGNESSKGNYVELEDSALHLYGALLATPTQADGNSRPDENPNDYMTDIAVGAAGSEEVIIPDMYTTVVGDELGAGIGSIFFPAIRIPSGSRIAMRTRGTGATGDDQQSWVLHGFY